MIAPLILAGLLLVPGQTNTTCRDGACYAFPTADRLPMAGLTVVASSDPTYGRPAAQPCQTGACPITASTQAQPSPTWVAAPFPQYTVPPGTYVPPRVRVASPVGVRDMHARGFRAGVRRPLGGRVMGGRCGLKGC